MEFTGPYQDLLRRMYERCVQMGWFGPENDVGNEQGVYVIPDQEYYALLSLEEIQELLPFLDQYEFTHDLIKGTTTVMSIHDKRLKHFAYPPATHKQIAQTEAAIGFPLPQFLRDIYMQLANGGFGYGQGFVGAAGGAGSGKLRSIDQGVGHASWKLSESAPDGLVEPGTFLRCDELPDRFIPWTGWIHCYIDGWTGRLYRIESYPFDHMTRDFWMPPPINDYARWQEDDSSEIEYIDTPANILNDEPEERWEHAIQYEAPSLEAWIEKWLASPLP